MYWHSFRTLWAGRSAASNIELYLTYGTSHSMSMKQKRVPLVRIELTTFRLWDWRAAYCATEAHVYWSISKHKSWGIWGSRILNWNSFESPISFENHSLSFINSIIFDVSFFTLEKLSMFHVYILNTSAEVTYFYLRLHSRDHLFYLQRGRLAQSVRASC